MSRRGPASTLAPGASPRHALPARKRRARGRGGAAHLCIAVTRCDSAAKLDAIVLTSTCRGAGERWVVCGLQGGGGGGQRPGARA